MTVKINEEKSVSIEETKNKFEIVNLAITLLDLEESKATLASKVTKLDPINHSVFFEFFEKHIDDTRNGKNTLECRFIDVSNTITKKIERYKEELTENSFLTFANEISDNLFNIMKNATRSSGSFFIIHAFYNDEEFIVILKLDPIDGVQLDMDKLILNKIENILPDSNERVHKCALIKVEYLNEKTQLFVIDKQQRAGEISQFFMGTFLQAIPNPNDRIKTKCLIQELHEKITLKLSESEREILEHAIDTEIVNGAMITIPSVVKNILNKTVSKDKIDRDIFVDDVTKEFMGKFNTKYKDFSSNLTVERNDINYTYKANNNQILFKYNKSLDKSSVFVNFNSEDDEVNIKIKNASTFDFKKNQK